MSLEIPQGTIDQVYAGLDSEGAQDFLLVAVRTQEADSEGRSLDSAFMEELAEARRAQALDQYGYPVEGTAPTLQSSLRIVRDITTIRELEATRDERLEGVDLRGAGDVKMAAAEGQERSHRLWEKGILRIFDHGTRKSMWSVEFDDILVGRREGPERVQALTDALVRRNAETRRRPRS